MMPTHRIKYMQANGTIQSFNLIDDPHMQADGANAEPNLSKKVASTLCVIVHTTSSIQPQIQSTWSHYSPTSAQP